MSMKTVSIPESKCPHCQKPLNRSTDPDGENTPSPGDLSICWYCGELAIHGENLELRKLEESELAEIAETEPETYQYLQQLRSKRQIIKGEG